MTSYGHVHILVNGSQKTTKRLAALLVTKGFSQSASQVFGQQPNPQRIPLVTCTQVSCEHQRRAYRVIGHIASYRQYSACVWVEEVVGWHCHGVAIAQQHVAVGARPYEACEQITMKCKAITQGAIRTWETEEKNG